LDEPAFEASTQVYVDPEGVLTAAPAFRPRGSDSIHALEDVPEEKKELIETNAAFYQC
jgi:hypothetical protein